MKVPSTKNLTVESGMRSNAAQEGNTRICPEASSLQGKNTFLSSAGNIVITFGILNWPSPQ